MCFSCPGTLVQGVGVATWLTTVGEVVVVAAAVVDKSTLVWVVELEMVVLEGGVVANVREEDVAMGDEGVF